MKCPKCKHEIDEITGSEVQAILMKEHKKLEKKLKKEYDDRDLVETENRKSMIWKLSFIEELIPEIEKKKVPFMFDDEESD